MRNSRVDTAPSVSRSAAADAAGQDGASGLCTAPVGCARPASKRRPTRPKQLFPAHARSKELAPLRSDGRITLSFPSDPNSVSIYWRQRLWTKGAFLETSSGGLVTYLMNKHVEVSTKCIAFNLTNVECASWTIKKAEHRRIDAFELWCWRRLLRVPWTARRSNQSILKEISPACSLEGLMLRLKFQYIGHLM